AAVLAAPNGSFARYMVRAHRQRPDGDRRWGAADDGRSRLPATRGRLWPRLAERRVGPRHPWMRVGSGAWGEHSRARFARASGGMDRGRPAVLVRPARQPYPAAEHPDRVVPDGSRAG